MSRRDADRLADITGASDAPSTLSAEQKAKAGLEDVVAGESAICYLDGDRGVLAYHGYDVHDLANAERGASFEEVCFLLWHGRLPNRAELGDLQTQLAAARLLPESIIRAMKSLPKVDGMDALRTLTSILHHHDPDATVNIGVFISGVINFIIMAFVVFMIVKMINKIREPKGKPAPAAPTAASRTSR